MSGVLNPEDLPRFDKQESPPELTEKERSPRRKTVLFAVTLILFIIGFLAAPAVVAPGNYEVTISFSENNYTFSIILEEGLTQPEDKVVFPIEFGEIEYFNRYPSISGTVLSFQLFANVSIQDVERTTITGHISSTKLNHTFLGDIISETNINYTFKILTDTSIALGLLFAISFLWLTELIPLAASALIIPVVLAIMEIQTATKALSYFAEPIIFLFIAGFLMAEAMQRTKLDQFISYRLFAAIPPNDKFLLFTMMTLAASFSMFMSNTASTAILIPLSIQLLKGVDLDEANYRKATVIGIAYAATIGGIGSQIGTAPNIIAVELLKDFNPVYDVSFTEWFLFGLPVVFIMLPIIFGYLWARFKPNVSKDRLRAAQVQVKIKIQEELQLTKQQFIVMLIFILTFGLWLTSQYHGISTGIVAVLGAVLLYIVGQLTEEDLNQINWNALITFGGGLSLGGLIIQTGLADYIGTRALFLAGLPLVVVLFAISLVGLILTAFASNTASAVILIPIVMPLGSVLGISPVVLAILVAIAASIDFAIVIGTPPTMIAYSTGLFRVQEIFRIGIVLDFIGLIVITLISWLLFGVFAGWIV